MANKIIIAEIGVNHNGSVDIANKLVESCAKAKADIIKTQFFKTDEIISKNCNLAEYQKQNGVKNQYDLVKKLELNIGQIKQIKKVCDFFNIEFLVTPFSKNDLKLLIKYNIIKRVKISSGELINLDLLNYVGQTRLPVILSTGMAELIEIEIAIVELIKGYIKSIKKCHHEDLLNKIANYRSKIVLLHCNTSYPVKMKDSNLGNIKILRERFNLNIGYSDHTIGYESSMIASALGVSIFEKHVTFDNNAKGPDHKASLNVKDLREYIRNIKKVSMNINEFKRSRSELKIKEAARKSLHKGSKNKPMRPYSGDSLYFHNERSRCNTM